MTVFGLRPRDRSNGFGSVWSIVRTLFLLPLLSLPGCISVEKFEQPPTVLRDAIRNGELVRPGQHVSIVTSSRGELVFAVTEVDQDVVRGESVEIPIQEIVALEIRRVDVLGTVTTLAGWYVLTGIALAIAMGMALD